MQWRLDKFFKPSVILARPIPRIPLDIIADFKKDFQIEALRVCWKRLRDGDPYDLDGSMRQSGMIYDRTQQVALITSEVAIECLNLRGLLALPNTRLEHKTEREIQAEIHRGKLKGEVFHLGNVPFSANMLELLVKTLKKDWITGEEGHYSMGILAAKRGDRNGQLLIIRNNVTLMLGLLASKQAKDSMKKSLD